MMYEAPETWHTLMAKLVDQVTSYLQLQIASGVDAVQVFDSWVGCLSANDFAVYVVPHLKRLRDALADTVPLIYFGTGNHHLLPQVAELGFDVLAFDWRTPLATTWQALDCPAVQGNLDPIVLCADQPSIAAQSQRLLDDVGQRPGHIFNLGHGIIPETPVDNVKFLVDYVHEKSA
jgi:uroporphyrinogen decarboxylase